MHNFDPEEEEDAAIEELKNKYQEIIVHQMVEESEAKGPDQLRKIRIAALKAMLRETFLTNPLATEKDFNRLWPRMFDESLIEYAHNTQFEIMEKLVEGMSDDDEDDDLDDFDEDEFDDDEDDVDEDEEKIPF
jgi:hypothetical protein